MFANYHTHTSRCRHAQGAEQEYIERAIERGLDELGFSDHCPYLFPVGYVSGFRMFPYQYKDYVETLLHLKDKFNGRIRLLIGLETEYYPQCFEDFLSFTESIYKPDYLILGQHFLNNEYDGVYCGKEYTELDHLRRYTDQVIQGMDTGRFAYIAHPDLLRFSGDKDQYYEEALRLCQAARIRDIPLEINFYGINDKRHYPREEFWKAAGESGAPVIFGCDAHTPDALARPEDEHAALKIAEKYGLHVIQKITVSG